MKCEELLVMLNEHVDGRVAPAVRAAFETHPAGCHPGQVVVDDIRKTITPRRRENLANCPSSFANSSTPTWHGVGRKQLTPPGKPQPHENPLVF